MAKGPQRFTQREVARAIRAVEAAGHKAGAVKFVADGFEVLIKDADGKPDDADSNEWNSVQ